MALLAMSLVLALLAWDLAGTAPRPAWSDRAVGES